MGSRAPFGLVLALVALAACGSLVGLSDDSSSPGGGTTDQPDASAPRADGAAGSPDAALDGSSELDAGADAAHADAALDAGCLGAQQCERAIFVTSESYTGNFGSLKTADSLCQGLADKSTVARIKGRTFLAWLSDNSTSPSQRLVQGTSPYVTPDGTGVASDWTQLISTMHEHTIDKDENGGFQLSVSVWTATQGNGTAISTNCTNWTSTGSNGKIGNSGLGLNSSQWTDYMDQSCSTKAHLYCVEK